MKRSLIAMFLVGLLAVFAITSVVSAQGPNPTQPGPGQGGPGYGRGGRGGMMGSGGMGLMHPYMAPILAEKLGLTEAAFTELHTSGETFWTIAESQGLTVEEAQQIMLDARSEALDQMVADEVITQEQADWMKTRGAGMGQGGCRGRGGNRGGQGAGMMGGRWSQDS